jgi:hypothetical protein
MMSEAPNRAWRTYWVLEHRGSRQELIRLLGLCGGRLHTRKVAGLSC